MGGLKFPIPGKIALLGSIYEPIPIEAIEGLYKFGRGRGPIFDPGSPPN